MSLLWMLAAAAQGLVAYPPVMSGSMRDGDRFMGGPYAGLSMGKVALPDGRVVRAVLPSKPGSSRITSGRVRAVVDAFVAGYANPSSEPLASFLTDKTVFVTCPRIGERCSQTPPEPLKFGEAVTANAPYVIDGDTVRIEWLHGTALYYISELHLRRGKIAWVRTQPAWVPIFAKRGRR